MQNNEDTYNTHTINNDNGPANRRHTSWLEFYNRQDMMIMEEIVRAANLYHSAANNNLAIQHGSVKVAPSPPTSSAVASTTSNATCVSVSASGVPSSQRPSPCNVPTQLSPEASYGGAGDTAPVHCNLDPPPGSVLLQNMLLVPIAQTAPMLDTDLRLAQEFFPPLSYVQRQEQGTDSAVDVPPLNVWPQDVAPQQHEFFERSRNIIRSLQQNWSPIFGTYVNIPVCELTTVPTMAPQDVENDKEAITPKVHIKLPPAQSACAPNGSKNSEVWETTPQIDQFETADDVDPIENIKSIQGELTGKVEKKKKSKVKSAGPEPVEPPCVATVGKPILSYSDVVRKLAVTHPLDRQYNGQRASTPPIINEKKAKSTYILHRKSVNGRSTSSFFNDKRELHCTIYRRRTETSTSRQQITKINLEVTQHREMESPADSQEQTMNRRRRRGGRKNRRGGNRNPPQSTLSLQSPVTNAHMKSLFNDLSMSSSHTSIEPSSSQQSVIIPESCTFQKDYVNSACVKPQEKQQPPQKDSELLPLLPTNLARPEQTTRVCSQKASKSMQHCQQKSGKYVNGRRTCRRRQRLPHQDQVSLLQNFNEISASAFNLLTGFIIIFINFVIRKFFKSR